MLLTHSCIKGSLCQFLGCNLWNYFHSLPN